MLETLGVEHFLPMKSEYRQWSDRKQLVESPLFSGYLFVKIDILQDSKLQVLKTRGVVSLVGNQTGPLPIPDDQIEAIRTVLDSGLDCIESPELFEGDRVRVIRGPLSGLEGTLVRNQSDTRLIITVDMIQRSVSVGVSRQDVEVLMTTAA